MTRIIAGHQPDLLPYSGFWYKMAKADIFDLKLWDQYVNRGYQRRVMMRDSWTSIALTDQSGSYCAITDKRIDPSKTLDGLVAAVGGRYRNARHFKERSVEIFSIIERAATTEKLWQFNLELIIGIRDFLGIETPLAMARPTIGSGSKGLVSVLKRYKPTHYLSGTGARTYMGDCQDFTDAGIKVIWSNHKALSGDSILTSIFDYEDPMQAVMLENEDVKENA